MMRTLDQIREQLKANGNVDLSARESDAYDLAENTRTEAMFFSYSETITVGEKTITKTASVSVPVSFGSEAAVLGTLRACVQGTSGITLAE